MMSIREAFADELIKLGSDAPASLIKGIVQAPADPTVREIVQESTQPSPRNYLKSMLLGAVIAPLMGVGGKGIARALHNREIRKAMSKAKPMSRRAKDLRGEMKTGPLFGSPGAGSFHSQPMVTPGSLISDAATGALTGSVVQALRDATNPDRRR